MKYLATAEGYACQPNRILAQRCTCAVIEMKRTSLRIGNYSIVPSSACDLMIAPSSCIHRTFPVVGRAFLDSRYSSYLPYHPRVPSRLSIGRAFLFAGCTFFVFGRSFLQLFLPYVPGSLSQSWQSSFLSCHGSCLRRYGSDVLSYGLVMRCFSSCSCMSSSLRNKLWFRDASYWSCLLRAICL